MEGLSLTGLHLGSTTFDALSRMRHLRILILDDVTEKMPSGAQLPCLAMLSWRNARGHLLPFALKSIKQAAVLDISGSSELARLPDDVQAGVPILFYLACRLEI